MGFIASVTRFGVFSRIDVCRRWAFPLLFDGPHLLTLSLPCTNIGMFKDTYHSKRLRTQQVACDEPSPQPRIHIGCHSPDLLEDQQCFRDSGHLCHGKENC